MLTYCINIDGYHEDYHETQKERGYGQDHHIHWCATFRCIAICYIDTVQKE